MRRVLFVLLFAASSLAFSCKDDPDWPPPGGGTGEAIGSSGSGGGGGDGGGRGEGGALDSGDGGDGGVCTDLANDGIVVDQNRIVGDPPTGTGGQIADGTYSLTQADVYVGAAGVPGPSGVTFQGAMRLTQGTLERVLRQQANQTATPTESRSTGPLTARGTTFTVVQSCPAQFQDQYTYSVLNNTLNITSLLTKESFTFTLR